MSTYFPLISILVLFVFATLPPIIYAVRKSLALAWLVALVGSLASWILVLLSWRSSPFVFLSFQWEPVELFVDSPTWLVDGISWSFAFALTSLVVAVILTDVAREFEVESSSWAGSMALTGLGLMTVFSGNLISLMIGWAALDIADLILVLRNFHTDAERRAAVVVFSTRCGGIFLSILGILSAGSLGLTIAFDRIPQSAAIYLILAASLRLGVVPFHVPFWSGVPHRRGIGTISRLVIAAGSLVFLVRVASVGLLPTGSSFVLLLTGLAGLYVGFNWFTSNNELEGRPFWILGMASLCMAAAIRGQQLASLAWGIGLIFAGGFSFLYSSRNRFLSGLSTLIGITLLGAPFTPSWQGSHLYASPFILWQVLFLFTQAFLALGLIRHSMKPADSLRGSERWVYLIYPTGLILLLVSYLLAGWRAGLLLPSADWGLHIFNILPSLLVLGISALFLLVRRQTIQIPGRILLILRNIFSFRWFYASVDWLFWVSERVTAFVTMILEGEGGILWALLLVALLIAYITLGGLAGG
jgi:hypothetical protein